MSSDLNELFAFALDFYRAPLQHQGKLEVCEPDSTAFTRLLEIVSRPDSSNDLNTVATALQKSPDTLISAALFLIRQLLFAEKSNHYEVLGLQQTASLKEIKRRYRTLISLFHPDKNPEGEEWSQLYTPDLNEAYNVLKNESRRNSYDLTLSSDRRSRQTTGHSSGRRSAPQSGQRASSTASRPHRARRTSAQNFSSSKYEAAHKVTLWQKHPKLMIWGSALAVLGLIIAAASLRSPDNNLDLNSSLSDATDAYKSPASSTRKQVSSINETGDALKFALKKTAPSYSKHKAPDSTGRRDNRVTPTEDVSAVINRYMTEEGRAELSPENNFEQPESQTATLEEATPGYTENPTVNTLADDVQYESSVESVTESVAEPVTRLAEAKTPVNQASPAKPAAPVQKNNTVAKTSSIAAVTATAAVSAGNTNYQAQISSDKAPNPFSKEKIEFLIAQYISAYDSGNLNKMTALFTDDVKTSDGIGIAIIRNDYFKLFRDTTERSIAIENIKTDSRQGISTSIQFQAYVQVRRAPNRNWKYYSGRMRFTLAPSNNALKISALSHSISQNK